LAAVALPEPSHIQIRITVKGITMSVMNKAIRCAVAAAVASAAAGSANALSVNGYPYTNQINVYISGSTALDPTLSNAAVQTASGQIGLCVSGTTDIYLIGTSQKLILCTSTNAGGLPAGRNLAIFKESEVGSANGVQPLINAAKGLASGTRFINPAGISDATCGTPATTTAVGDFGTFVTHPSCPASGVTGFTIVPTGGVADVEAAILQTAAGTQVSAADAATYLTTPSGTVDQVWGVPVTKTLYYALQDAEGLTASCPAAYTLYGSVVTGSIFAGRDSPSCAPSLSKAQISSVLTGAIFSGTGLGVATNATDDTMYLCRRDFGSGTEASYEYLFVGERCGKTSLSVQGESASVWAAGSGGGVRTCLQAFNNGGKTLTHFYATDTFAPSAGSYAFGFLNTEVTASNLSGAGDAFRFIAVDGALPQISNVQNGTYPYFSTGASYKILSGPNAPSGDALTAFNAVTKLIGHPLWTADSNTNYSANPWGVAGDVSPAPLYAATVPPTLPASHSTAKTNPTNAFTKALSGAVNNCDVGQFDSNDLSANNPVESQLLGTGTVNN
jgi:hypothetical protein